MSRLTLLSIVQVSWWCKGHQHELQNGVISHYNCNSFQAHLQLNFEQYKKTHIKFWFLIIIIIIIIFNYLRLLLLSLQAAFSVGASFSHNIILFAILRFATAASLTGFFVVQYVYILELVGPSFRTMSGKGSGFFWAIGSGASALLAYNIQYWRTLLLVASFPPLLFVVFYT